MPDTGSKSPQRLLTRALAVLTLCYVLAGLFAMLWLSPKVPYADGWRLLGNLASQPFPSSLWHADNGHREVVPNLVRLLDLRVFDGNQWLQIGVGVVLALATFVALLRAMRFAAGDRLRTGAAICAAAVLLFWLGNQRTLAHANETVHAYLITLCLAAGLVLLRRDDARSLPGAIVLAVIATFSFGSGIACFAAFAVALRLQRRGLRSWLWLGGGAAFAVVAYLWGNAGAGNLQFAPLTQLSLLLRWLSAPFAYALWPAVDSDVAAQVPTALGPGVMVPVAQSWERLFGPFETANWPWLGIGSIGIALFVALLLRARRQPHANGIATVGLGLAAFGLATGIAIAAARAGYFTQHADQLMATRYVVWSSLFWGGLLLAWVGSARQSRAAAMAVIAVATLLVPSQLWMAQLAQRMNAAAERGAAMAASGVVDASTPLGETVPGELAIAMPLLRHKHTTVFAWPEAGRLRTTLDAGTQPVPASDWNVTPITALDGSAAARVSFRADASTSRLLIADRARIVRGIALRDRRQPGYWMGWIAGKAPADALMAVPER